MVGANGDKRMTHDELSAAFTLLGWVPRIGLFSGTLYVVQNIGAPDIGAPESRSLCLYKRKIQDELMTYPAAGSAPIDWEAWDTESLGILWGHLCRHPEYEP